MASPSHVTGLWRNIEARAADVGPGFQFTGNPAPNANGHGYELTPETAFAASGMVEWMRDPATGTIYPQFEQAYHDLTGAVATRGLSGNDEAIGSDFGDIFSMGAGQDTVFAREGNDQITGGAGDDVLHGQQGDDVIDGGEGVDHMFGGEGDDTFFVDDARDVVVEGAGAGHDTVYASVSYALGSDVWVETLATTSQTGTASINLAGNDYAQVIVGNAGANVLSGGGGDDVLLAGGGDDVLVGGTGNDVMTGGDGIDTAAYGDFRVRYTVVGDSFPKLVSSTSEGSDVLDGIEQLTFLDGRIVYDVGDRAATVYRMYDAMFDRAPDSSGFNYWVDAIEGGLGVQDMAQSFASSREFQEKYGNLSNKGFVEQLYQNVLKRPGEAEGVSFWAGKLDAGAMSRGQVLAGFSESKEHVEMLRGAVEAGLWDLDGTAAQMARLYSAAFDRHPDADGLSFWTNSAKAGTFTAPQVADFFVASPEFTGKYGTLTNSEFVDRMYHNILDRAGEAEGSKFWVHALDTGTFDRGDVLAGFSESNENKIKTAPDMEHGILLA